MSQSKNNDLRLAVLIDADNVPAKAIHVMMVEIANYGKPTIKRIYGDFTFSRVFATRPCALKFRPCSVHRSAEDPCQTPSPGSAA